MLLVRLFLYFLRKNRCDNMLYWSSYICKLITEEVKMNKEIYFCVDSTSFNKVITHIVSLDFNWASCFDYATTEKNLKEECRHIVTSSIAHLSFDLLTLGYDIYLCYKDKRIKIEPHMDLSGIGEAGKDLRFAHNIFKLFRAGIFNDLLGIEKGGDK